MENNGRTTNPKKHHQLTGAVAEAFKNINTVKVKISQRELCDMKKGKDCEWNQVTVFLNLY